MSQVATTKHSQLRVEVGVLGVIYKSNFPH